MILNKKKFKFFWDSVFLLNITQLKQLFKFSNFKFVFVLFFSKNIEAGNTSYFYRQIIWELSLDLRSYKGKIQKKIIFENLKVKIKFKTRKFHIFSHIVYQHIELYCTKKKNKKVFIFFYVNQNFKIHVSELKPLFFILS